jgi:hypothetical protein
MLEALEMLDLTLNFSQQLFEIKGPGNKIISSGLVNYAFYSSVACSSGSEKETVVACPSSLSTHIEP